MPWPTPRDRAAGRIIPAAEGEIGTPPVQAPEEFRGAGLYLEIPPALPATLGGDVFVAGRPLEAALAALRLSAHCRRVVILTRGPSPAAGLPPEVLAGIRAMQNISARSHVARIVVIGIGRVEAVVLHDGRTGRTTFRAAGALFVLSSRLLASGGAPA